MQKDLLGVSDLTGAEIRETIQFAIELKQKQQRGEKHDYLRGKSLAMIFQKPSTRTRVSFEVGMYQLGGQSVYLGPDDIQITRRESTADIARTLSRYVDIIMARLFAHDGLVELAESSTVPVINGLTDFLHPCQILADMLTIQEKRGSFENLRVSYIGDGNNVANSWVNMASRIPMTLRLAVPPGYEPDADLVASANTLDGSSVEVLRDPKAAAKDAHVLYTDVWASMGQEDEAERRRRDFQHYQINNAVLECAADDCVVMHCLPAHREEEITNEVIEGPQSIVFDQAENRLHAQKAIMVKLLQ